MYCVSFWYIFRFKPEFIRKLRERHEPKLETHYNDIYSAIIEGIRVTYCHLWLLLSIWLHMDSLMVCSMLQNNSADPDRVSVKTVVLMTSIAKWMWDRACDKSIQYEYHTKVMRRKLNQNSFITVSVPLILTTMIITVHLSFPISFMMYAQCVIFQYISDVPSKPLPMGELPGFLKVTKSSLIGFETEYNVCYTIFSWSI